MTYEEKEKHYKTINVKDIEDYDGVIDQKYLKYAISPGEGDELSLEKESGSSLEDDFMEIYHDNNFSDDSEDTLDLLNESAKRRKSRNSLGKRIARKKVSFTDNNFATISEKPEEEYDDEESRYEKERLLKEKEEDLNRKEEVKNAVMNAKFGTDQDKKNKKKGKDKDKDKDKKDKKAKKDKKKKDKKDKKDKKKKIKKKKKKNKNKNKSNSSGSEDGSDAEDEMNSEDLERAKKAEKRRKRKMEREEEKKYKIFEYDLQENQMEFQPKAQPNKLKSINLGHSIWLSAIIYIPEKNVLVTGGYDDHQVKIWRIDKNTFNTRKIAEYRGHKGHITIFKYVPSRQMLVVGSQDCSYSILCMKKISNLDEGEDEKDVFLEDNSNELIAEIENK